LKIYGLVSFRHWIELFLMFRTTTADIPYEAEREARYKTLVRQSKLLDFSKAQTTEAQLLQDELDQLHMATYPHIPKHPNTGC